ncbi:MAG: hypothetical protein JRI97_05240 [Deltaproteobacteria bacterium]|nr:hypothetical protein [Deltaproteobacteria bacterium]
MVQKIWGTLLAAMGVLLILRVPEVTSQIARNSGWSQGTLLFARISLYLVGIILLGGGIRKLAGRGNRSFPPGDGGDREPDS